MAENKNKVGRPKGEPTKLINFRAPIALIDEVKKKHGSELNALFIKWMNSLKK